MWCGAQRQEADSSEWWVWVTSRWTALCSKRGGGELVQEIWDMRTNATDGGAVLYRGETKISRKLFETGGVVEIE